MCLIISTVLQGRTEIPTMLNIKLVDKSIDYNIYNLYRLCTLTEPNPKKSFVSYLTNKNVIREKKCRNVYKQNNINVKIRKH